MPGPLLATGDVEHDGIGSDRGRARQRTLGVECVEHAEPPTRIGAQDLAQAHVLVDQQNLPAFTRADAVRR